MRRFHFTHECKSGGSVVKRRTYLKVSLLPEVCFSSQTATSQSPCRSTVVPMDFPQMHKVFASSQDPREACDRNPNPALARGGSCAEFEVSVKGYAMHEIFCQRGMFRSGSFHSRVTLSHMLANCSRQRDETVRA